MKETQHIGTFVGRDGDGNEYTVFVFQEYHMVSTGGFQRRINGHKSMETDEGDPVNFVAAGQYDVVTFNGMVRITSDDPAAPKE